MLKRHTLLTQVENRSLRKVSLCTDHVYMNSRSSCTASISLTAVVAQQQSELLHILLGTGREEQVTEFPVLSLRSTTLQAVFVPG